MFKNKNTFLRAVSEMKQFLLGAALVLVVVTLVQVVAAQDNTQVNWTKYMKLAKKGVFQLEKDSAKFEKSVETASKAKQNKLVTQQKKKLQTYCRYFASPAVLAKSAELFKCGNYMTKTLREISSALKGKDTVAAVSAVEEYYGTLTEELTAYKELLEQRAAASEDDAKEVE